MRKLIAPLLALAIAAAGCTAPPPGRPIQRVDDVAIIVVDDFTAGDDSPANAQADRNCTYSPESANDVISHGAGDGLPTGISHGDAVYTQLAQDLNATTELTAVPTRRDEDARWTYHGKQILLTKLDTATFDTTQLADRLQNRVEALAAGPTPYRRFVLNLSFVIAPCNVPAWLRQRNALDENRVIALYRSLVETVPELAKFRDTLEALAHGTDRSTRLAAPDDGLGPIRSVLAPSLFYAQLDQNREAVLAAIQSDPLKSRIDLLTARGYQVIPVGAAGNGIFVPSTTSAAPVRRQYDFPFAPALWNSVVSASASDEDPTARAAYSNSGEILLDGRTPLPGGTARGTSFAAPRLSALESLYLLTGGTTTCGKSFPALGYTNSEVTGQTWLNLDVIGAAAAHCPAFLRRLTPTT